MQWRPVATPASFLHGGAAHRRGPSRTEGGRGRRLALLRPPPALAPSATGGAVATGGRKARDHKVGLDTCFSCLRAGLKEAGSVRAAHSCWAICSIRHGG